MTRGTSLIILALLIIIAPFSGLPNSWLMVILPVIGLIVLIIGTTLRHHNPRTRSANSHGDAI